MDPELVLAIEGLGLNVLALEEEAVRDVEVELVDLFPISIAASLGVSKLEATRVLF